MTAPLAHRHEDFAPLVLALCDGTPVCSGVNLDVHEADEMWRLFYYRLGEDRDRALAMYFQSGLLVWSALKRIVEHRFGPLGPGDAGGRVGKLLDFASGYGRVTRFIVHDLPPERVWVSDIYAGGVAFQKERFGVHGIVSTADPADFPLDERFDVILVSSLFSHLPEATFHSWLRRLCGLLAPGGMLVMSVHDPSLLPAGREMPPGGLLFEEESESASLSKAQYGTTWVSEAFVRAAIARAAPGASVARIPRGFSNFQDLYVVVGAPDADLSGLASPFGVEGFVEFCGYAPPDLVQGVGWAADRATGEPVREVRAEIDGRIALRAGGGELTPRPDVGPVLYPTERVQPMGWRLTFRLPPGTDARTARLSIVAADAAGKETVLFESPLQAALLRSARLDLFESRRIFERSQADFEQRFAAHQAWAWAEIANRDARIAAMEASRFWKLRNRWFAVKRRLGLTADRP